MSNVAPNVPSFVAIRWVRLMMPTDIPFPHPDVDVLDKYVEAEIVADNLAGRLGACGRWVARCISEDCMGAEDVDPDQLLFMCCHCFNRDNNHKWLKVRMPKDRTDIENVLLKRPAKNRFWSKVDSLADLKKENIAHGFEV